MTPPAFPLPKRWRGARKSRRWRTRRSSETSKRPSLPWTRTAPLRVADTWRHDRQAHHELGGRRLHAKSRLVHGPRLTGDPAALTLAYCSRTRPSCVMHTSVANAESWGTTPAPAQSLASPTRALSSRRRGGPQQSVKRQAKKK